MLGVEDLRLSRPRLAERVRVALGRGSILVVAEAGYGKTTILQEALAAREQVAWVTITAADRDPHHLVTRLVSAVDTAVPGSSDELRGRLLEARGPVDANTVLSELIDELDRLLLEPLVVVLDEGEQLAGAADALAIVTTLLRRANGRVRVAVASRRPLRLRLAKPRAQGLLVELDFASLALEPGECAELLAAATGMAPGDDVVDAVMAATEGWPLAVAAVALSLSRQEVTPSAWARDRADRDQAPLHSPVDLRAFLVEEVLGSVESGLREQLIDASVPRYLTPAIAASMHLPDDFLDRVAAEGLLLRPLDIGAGSLAFHPLFRDCLRKRLAVERSDAEQAALHARAAAAMLVAGEVVDGIDHYLGSGAVADAVNALASHGDVLVRTAPKLVGSWLGRLPPEAREEPSVRILAARLAYGAGEFDEAVALLGSAVGDGATVGGEARWAARYLLIMALFLRGRFEEAAGVADGFTAAAPEDAPTAAAVGMQAADCLAALGRADASEEMAAEARRLADGRAVAPVDFLRRAHLDVPAGRLDDVVDGARELLDELERRDPLLTRISVLTAGAFALTEQGRLDEALDWWRRIEGEARLGLQVFMVSASCAWQALALAQLGRVSEAEAALAVVEHTRLGWLDYAADVARATVAAARGASDEAVAAAEGSMSAARAAAPVYRVLAAADLVPPLARVGAIERARDVLTDAKNLVGRVYPGEAGLLLSARLSALAAWLACLSGDEAASDAALVSVFEAAGAGVPCVLRREWERLERLVWSALERQVLQTEVTMPILSEAFPDGLALVAFADHPNPAVRRVALAPALASGHPSVPALVLARRADPDPRVAAAATTLSDQMTTVIPPRAFRLMGQFSVRRGAWPIDERAWGRPAAARLVRYLLVHADTPVHDEVLFEALWPNLSAAGARRSLQVAVSRARAALDHPAAVGSVIEGGGGTYRLRLDPADTVDAVEFEAAAAGAIAATSPDRTRLEHAASRWRGEPLAEDRYEDWATAWRERLRDRYAAVLSALVASCQADGDHHAALGAARRLVDLDPLDEDAHRQLMLAYARAGRRAAALRQYLECRRQLTGELGIEPAAATTRLQARILAGDDV